MADEGRQTQFQEDRITMRDEILSRWFNHYPESVFPGIEVEKMAEVLAAIEGTGVTSDALYASWARHLLFHVMLEIKQADEELLRV